MICAVGELSTLHKLSVYLPGQWLGSLLYTRTVAGLPTLVKLFPDDGHNIRSVICLS